MEKLYAAYGSNINVAQMKKRCPEATIVDVGMIQDMQLDFNKVATLHSVPGENSPALIWKLNEADEAKLDVYEGFPHKYHKEQVTVEIAGTKHSVMAYIMNDKENKKPPSEEYYNRISDGYAAFGFDFQYLEEAYDRALEYEDSRQISFSDYSYCPSNGVSNLSDDLLFQAFVVGQCAERYDLSFSPQEIKELTKFMSEDYSLSAFMDFEDYADAVFSDMAESYQSERKYYVAYGSNMNTEQMSVRCPNSTEVGTGEIIDYELQFNNYADIKPKSNALTPCVVWDISSDDWKTLDRYEGYPTLYTKEEVDIILNGERTTAIAYVMQRQYASPCLPHKAYLEGIAEGYVQHDIDTAPLTEALNRTSSLEKSKSRRGNRR